MAFCVCQLPTSSAHAGRAFDDGKADADSVPPACAVGAPGRMPAFRFARRYDSGSVRVMLLEPIKLDATLACASPDRLLKAAGGARQDDLRAGRRHPGIAQGGNGGL